MFAPTIPASRQNPSWVLQVPVPTVGLPCSSEARDREGTGRAAARQGRGPAQ